METVWTFRTRYFSVTLCFSPCDDLDLSWDETGETREGLESGKYEAFDARVAVYYKGQLVAADYLGQCIHDSMTALKDFKRSGYFTDMVRQACTEARRTLADRPKLRAA